MNQTSLWGEGLATMVATAAADAKPAIATNRAVRRSSPTFVTMPATRMVRPTTVHVTMITER